MQKIITTVIVGIISLAGFLRLDGTVTKSFAFTYDVGRDMLALQSFAHGHITLIGFTTGLPGVFYGPWWYVFLLLSFVLSGGNPAGVAGFLAGIGLLTVILLGVFGKKVSDNFLSIVLLALASASPKLVALASQIWNPNIAPLWMTLLLFVTVGISQSTENKKQLLLWFALGVLISLLFEAEIVFGTLFVAGFIVFLLICLRTRFNLARIFAAFVGFILILSPRILFELRHQFLMTKAAISFFFAPAAHQGFDMSVFVTRGQFVLSEWASAVANNNLSVGVLVLVCTCIIFMLFWQKMYQTERLLILLGMITTVVAYSILLGFHHDLWPHYLVGYSVLWVFIVSTALALVYRHVSKPLAIILGLGLVVYNLAPISLYHRFTQPLFVGDAAVYRNQLAVVDTVYAMAAKQPFAYIVYTPPIQDYTYQYLFAWYGKKTYGYVPADHPNLLFAIIEPDFDHPTLERDWIAAHATNGKIISEKKLPSGITVQERITQKANGL